MEESTRETSIGNSDGVVDNLQQRACHLAAMRFSFSRSIVDSQAFPLYEYDEEDANIIIMLIHRNLVHTQQHIW